MCEPTAILAIGAAASTALRVAAVERRSNREQDRLERQAGFAREQAGDISRAGAFEAGRTQLAGRAVAGQQAVAFAGANVAAGSGTARDIARESATATQEDVAIIRANAAAQARGKRIQADDLVQQGVAGRKQARTQGIATLLSGAANVVGLAR